MRKHHLILIGFCVMLWLSTGGRANAQEIDFTQYYLNLAGFNPGFTGAENYVDLKLAYRQGWNEYSVKNNYFYASAYGVIGATQQLALKKNSLRISNPYVLEKIKSDRRLRRRQGVGGMITSRTVGSYTSVSVNANYAYHLPISKKLNFSLGTRISYGSQRVDFNAYTVRNPIEDQFYQQLIQSNPGNQNFATLDFGTTLYSNRFYLGISSYNLGIKNLSGEHQLSITNKSQFSLQTGATFPLGSNWSLNSGVKLTKAAGYDLTWAVNERLRYKEFINMGGGYNSGGKIFFLFGVVVTEHLTVNYSYDHYLTSVSDTNTSVHELVLGIGLFTKFESKAKFW